MHSARLHDDHVECRLQRSVEYVPDELGLPRLRGRHSYGNDCDRKRATYRALLQAQGSLGQASSEDYRDRFERLTLGAREPRSSVYADSYRDSVTAPCEADATSVA